jgi:hypothetical protein
MAACRLATIRSSEMALSSQGTFKNSRPVTDGTSVGAKRVDTPGIGR